MSTSSQSIHSTSCKLTIAMPVFNNPRCVRIMIDSIVANTFKDWELLLVDDGSEEETLSLLSQYESVDKRIKLIQRTDQPKGAQTCRNIGLREAKGEYIIFFDSDDYVTADCLETRVNAIASKPELDFMVFPSGVVENDMFTEKHRFIYGYSIFDNDLEFFCRRILPFVVWNNIYRTESLRRNNITWDVNLRSLQDADFNVSVLLSGLKYEYFNCKPHFGYRIDSNAGSVSKKMITESHRKSHLYAIDKFYTSVQKKYGHKYDAALFMGTCFIYNSVFTDGIEPMFAKQMADVVGSHSYVYGAFMKLQILLTRMLSVVLPSKLSRQLPMALCLYHYQKLEKKKQLWP